MNIEDWTAATPAEAADMVDAADEGGRVSDDPWRQPIGIDAAGVVVLGGDWSDTGSTLIGGLVRRQLPGKTIIIGTVDQPAAAAPIKREDVCQNPLPDAPAAEPTGPLFRIDEPLNRGVRRTYRDIVNVRRAMSTQSEQASQDELAAQHDTDVEEQGDGSWDAVCRCNWESTGHEDRDAAESATDEHRHNPGD